MRLLSLIFVLLFSCGNSNHITPQSTFTLQPMIPPLSFPPNSWKYFLQHLPTSTGDIVDYRGKPIANQYKHTAIINYDVGTQDLQQCADALIRIRAEYLFSQKRYNEIGFHFTSGGYYSWSDYCKGIRPVNKGNRVSFNLIAPSCEPTHITLRKYLDIVYAYANTISLCNELKPTNKFEVGTVIIYPGSPGHCCMIMDAAVSPAKDTVYKLVEGYMPAQSIYVVANPYETTLSPWYHLHKGMIKTASFEFKHYYLRKFE